MSAEATLYRIHCILQARAAPCCVQPSRTKTAREDADDDPSDRARKRQATPQDLQEELAMLRQERDQLKQDKIELEQQKASLEATVNAIENELQNSECSVCQNTLHDPMTLPCGHNYCGVCVQTWSEKSQRKDKTYGFMVAACPDCRQEFQPSTIQHNLLFGRIANRFVEAADGQEHTEHAEDGVYTGQMFRGQREGRGVLVGKNGSQYEGEFKHGKENGQGEMTYANGDKYVGSWKKGEKEGMGIYTYKNNDKTSVAAGSRRNNEPATYDGEWKNGFMNGQGAMTYASGDKYVGQWARGKKEGGGVFTWTDGVTYDGEWKNDQKHGRGVLKKNNGEICEGKWEYDNILVAVGDRVKVINYIDWSGFPYIDVNAPDPLRGTVIQLEDLYRELLIKFDDSDIPFRVDGKNVTRTDEDDPGPPEPGPRDLQVNDHVMVVGTGDESADGTTGCVEDVDNNQGICDIRPDHNPDEIEKYHVDRLRRTGRTPDEVEKYHVDRLRRTGLASRALR